MRLSDLRTRGATFELKTQNSSDDDTSDHFGQNAYRKACSETPGETRFFDTDMNRCAVP